MLYSFIFGEYVTLLAARHTVHRNTATWKVDIVPFSKNADARRKSAMAPDVLFQLLEQVRARAMFGIVT